jgi:L,D-transpeptidase ErfK/SrfK
MAAFPLRVLLAGSALALAGCSLFAPAPKPGEPPASVTPASPAPLSKLPAASHRFEFDPKDQDVVGEVTVTVVGKDDTLPDLARRFNVGYEEIMRANPGVDPWLPGAGREIVLPTAFVLPQAPRTGIVINVAAMRLYYFPPRVPGKSQVVITHPIGIGKVGWSTPEGVTKIVARVKDPVWVPPASVRKEHKEDGDDLPPKVLPGPENPLGAYMFRLAWPTYLIHGTNKPYGVGMRSSHGCMRLYPEDIAILYEDVPLGTAVRVVNQPLVLGFRGGTLYAESFGPLETDPHEASHGPRPPPPPRAAKGYAPLDAKLKSLGKDIDWTAIGALDARGVPVPVLKGAPGSPVAVVAAATRVQNVLPAGATWDGKSENAVDEQQFREVLGAREPPPPAPSSPTGARP